MSKLSKRKLENPSLVSNKKRKIKKTWSTAQSEAGVVHVDGLNWTEVALPDRLDDAEGFYGLEEIDNVEVIRNENTNHALFRPKEANSLPEGKVDTEDLEEEWSGFEDSDPAKESHATENAIKSLSKVSKNESISKKPSASSKSQANHGIDSNIQFSILNNDSQEGEVDVTAWKNLNLSDKMLSAISRLGFKIPTPIQESAIPPIQEGKDVIGKAVTGSGKTLAFGIPILEDWLRFQNVKPKPDQFKPPTALILAPTRELAHQLRNHLTDLGKGLEEQPRIVTVTGGLSILKQQRQLQDADVVIGTPGRLFEVINSSHGLIDRLKQIKYLVVDEADRLLSEGNFKEFEEILDALDREVVEENGQLPDQSTKSDRQTLVFSATFHKGLQQKLSSKPKRVQPDTNILSKEQSMEYLLQKLSFRSSKPTFIDSNPLSAMSSTLHESIVECPAMEKDLYLCTTLIENSNLKTLVFTNSIASVKRLTPLLQNLSIQAVSLHSSMPQKSRLRSLEKFSSTSSSTTSAKIPSKVLIATDVAARGLDIPQVDQIIHYHVPLTADAYVHRSGRTARASNPGKSILLCSPQEVNSTTRLIGKIHSSKKGSTGTIQTSHLDSSLLANLRPIINLAAKITSSTLAKSKVSNESSWLRNAADELGVDYDSEEFEIAGEVGRRGRRGGREKKEKEDAKNHDKKDVGRWKIELNLMLENLKKRRRFGAGGVGGGGKYIAGSRVDVEKLLQDKS